MPSKKRTSTWKGAAVAPAPTGAAEDAAERAEGHLAPERRAAGQDGDESLEQQPADEEARAPSGEDPDEKIAEAAEAHQERAASDNRPARGKL